MNIQKAVMIDMIGQWNKEKRYRSLLSSEELECRLNALIRGKYGFRPMDRFLVPKSLNSEEVRPVTLPNRKDRLVLGSLGRILTCLLDETFSDHSHGFRPGRGTATLHNSMRHWPPLDALVQGGITRFFGRIDHSLLLKRLRRRLGPGNEGIVRLVGSFLSTPIYDKEGNEWQLPGIGIPPGTPISPILLNIYLDALDKKMEKNLSRWSWLRYERFASNMIFGIVSDPLPFNQITENRTAQRLKYLRQNIDKALGRLKLRMTLVDIRRGVTSSKRLRLTVFGLDAGLDEEGKLMLSALNISSSECSV